MGLGHPFSGDTLIVIAAFFSPTLAVIVYAYLAGRSASYAARIAAATLDRLGKGQANLQQTADETKQVADGTHLLVNSGHTLLLRRLATLTRMVADQNPDDVRAQEAASAAEADADRSEAAARALASQEQRAEERVRSRERDS